VRAVSVRFAAGRRGQHGNGGNESDHQTHASLLKVLLWLPCDPLSQAASNRLLGSPL
jgi:hypothetical protein